MMHLFKKKKPKLKAFVLSGGANMGCAQVGMLQALFEHGIYPDLLIGTSVGALNAAALATNPTISGISDLTEFWKNIKTGDVFPGGSFTRAWNLLKRDLYLVENTGLSKVIDRATRVREIEDLQLPIRIVTCDLTTGEEIIYSKGPLKEALLASAALPGVFPPIKHDGRILVDGGVVNAVPIWHAISEDVGEIYVLNVSGSSPIKNLRTPLDVITRSFSISRSQRFDTELREAKHNIKVFHMPRPIDRRDMYDFSNSEILMEETYKQSFAFLDAHRL
ncbi:MAG: patatin-like phospholipase family protein [Acidimicrobiia bacterium]|nr:patatin-like phospholipase family protein [Acidimicrobiia bacterium]